jgi:ABC-2 type transport system ATP-binding protein
MYFDEPLTGLDPLGIRKMKASITRRASEGGAVILSSHLLHLVEEICTHLLILQRGKMVAHGTMAEISQRFAAQPDANLEDIFFRATADAPTPPPDGPAGPPPPVLP